MGETSRTSGVGPRGYVRSGPRYSDYKRINKAYFCLERVGVAQDLFTTSAYKLEGHEVLLVLLAIKAAN